MFLGLIGRGPSMVKRVLLVASLLAAAVFIVLCGAACGSGSSEGSAASSASPSTDAKAEALAATKAYLADMRPAMKGEPNAFETLVLSQAHLVKIGWGQGDWDATLVKMRSARQRLGAAEKRAAKVEAPASLQKAHRSLLRYFELCGQSFDLELGLIDAGSLTDDAMVKVAGLFKKANDAYDDWYYAVNDASVVGLGTEIPFKTHY